MVELDEQVGKLQMSRFEIRQGKSVGVLRALSLRWDGRPRAALAAGRRRARLESVRLAWGDA
eukprot:6295977-Alexandrium_andersonii.AAC.1